MLARSLPLHAASPVHRGGEGADCLATAVRGCASTSACGDRGALLTDTQRTERYAHAARRLKRRAYDSRFGGSRCSLPSGSWYAVTRFQPGGRRWAAAPVGTSSMSLPQTCSVILPLV